jgi:hypothetical protein
VPEPLPKIHNRPPTSDVEEVDGFWKAGICFLHGRFIETLRKLKG